MFIAVGLFTSILSLFRYQKFIVFFYAGLIFIAVGIVRMVSNRMKGETESKELHHPQKHSQQIKYCHQCGNLMRLHDRFCVRCGARV